jgi:flagellar FliL protein
MSTAAAAPITEEGAVPAKKGKKKLFIILGAAVLVLALAGGGAVYYMKAKAAAAAAAEEGDDGESHASAHKRDPKAVPTFVPLDPFTVNLADRDAERYAQVGVSLELANAHEADRIKNFMPVIRNNILLVLAQKTSVELLARDGKTQLAREIQLETAKALGVDVAADSHADGADTKDAKDGDDTKPAKKKKSAKAQELPVSAVHFSNFIIQ